MLALYCQTKYRELKDRNNQITDIFKYYTKLESIRENNNKTDLPKCRVCLQSASVYIYKQSNREDIVEALEIFGNIDLNSEDQYPKHLCIICWKFIQEAILFRKIAVKSNKILNEPEKTFDSGLNSRKSDDFSPIDQCDNLNHEDNNVIIEDIQNWNINLDTHISDDFIKNNDDNIHIWTQEEVKTRKLSRRMIKCNICDKIMDSKYYYNKHVVLHDPYATKNKYSCKKCGKEFKNPQALIDHQVIHTGQFPFKCDYCPYRGRTKDALNNHTKIHKGVKKHLCIHCPAQFYSSSNLKTHMYKHQTPKFQCTECARAFHTEFLLKKHVDDYHLGIRPHVCEICGKAFGYRKKLTDHLKGVHKRTLLPGRMPAYLAEQIKLNTQDN